jgi:hypothetical protein
MSEYTMAKTFKEFQRRNHCSQLHPDDMEKWLWEMIEENTQLKAALETSEANGAILAGKLAHVNHTICNAYKNRSTEAAYQAVCLDLMMYTNDYREYPNEAQ